MSKEKRFNQLASKLNELMRSDLISDLENKPIPYLGWFWRDISPDVPRLSLSQPSKDGPWWIDEANKWDYPSKLVDVEESIEILEQAANIVESHLKLLGSLAEDRAKE